jgi:hypothetical protein
MSKFWDDVKNAIVDGYVYAADRAEELTQIGRAKMDILSTNRRIANTMSELGGIVFEFYDDGKASDILEDAGILSAIEQIKDERKELERLRAEIAEIKETREAESTDAESTDAGSTDAGSTDEAGSQERG